MWIWLYRGRSEDETYKQSKFWNELFVDASISSLYKVLDLHLLDLIVSHVLLLSNSIFSGGLWCLLCGVEVQRTSNDITIHIHHWSCHCPRRIPFRRLSWSLLLWYFGIIHFGVGDGKTLTKSVSTALVTVDDWNWPALELLIISPISASPRGVGRLMKGFTEHGSDACKSKHHKGLRSGIPPVLHTTRFELVCCYCCRSTEH